MIKNKGDLRLRSGFSSWLNDARNKNGNLQRVPSFLYWEMKK